MKIAPLILLTFVENAFKHGVSQELKAAKVDISLMMEGENIVFSVYNTKPLSKTLKAKKSVGLNNIRLQLDLLYADQYTIRVDEREESYFVELRLRSR